MGPLQLVRLTGLMDRTSSRPEIRVGLIDGPVLLTYPDLASENIQEVRGELRGTCASARDRLPIFGNSLLSTTRSRKVEQCILGFDYQRADVSGRPKTPL